MKLANSAGIEIPKLVYFGRPPMNTDNLGHWIDGIVATRTEDPNSIRMPTDRYDRMAHAHDDIETISKKIAY